MRVCFFFFSSRRRHTRCSRDWSSDVCSSDLGDDLEPYAIRGDGFERIAGLRIRRGGELAQLIAGLGRPVLRAELERLDRKSVVEGKRVDLGGRRIIKKKKKRKSRSNTVYTRT